MASQNSPKVRVRITEEDFALLRILRATMNAQKVFLMFPRIDAISDLRGHVIVFPNNLLLQSLQPKGE